VSFEEERPSNSIGAFSLGFCLYFRVDRNVLKKYQNAGDEQVLSYLLTKSLARSARAKAVSPQASRGCSGAEPQPWHEKPTHRQPHYGALPVLVLAPSLLKKPKVAL